jgi:hypothetical protein
MAMEALSQAGPHRVNGLVPGLLPQGLNNASNGPRDSLLRYSNEVCEFYDPRRLLCCVEISRTCDHVVKNYFPLASCFALLMTSSKRIGWPFLALLSSAACMKARISKLSSSATGALPERKNRAMAVTSGS